MKKSLILLASLGWIAASLGEPVFSESPAPPPAVQIDADLAPPPAAVQVDTNAAMSPPANIISNPPHSAAITEITSRRTDFDLKASTATYTGDVRVKDPRMDLTCEVLTIKLSPSGGKFENGVAERNVSIEYTDDKGQHVHGTGGRAVYTYNITSSVTNDMIELFDDPALETAQGTLKGDVITLDRANNAIRATNSRMVVRPDMTDANPPATNPPPTTPASPTQ